MSKDRKNKHIVVFTDGSCSGNGKKNALGGIGIHFPNKELSDVSKIYRQGFCTSQKTELFAILTALRYIKQNLGLSNKQILIKTDSEYSINCVTNWINLWLKNGWKTKNKTPVANREFIEAIHKYYENYDITLEHVDGHTGLDDDDSIGNAAADKLATRATKRAIEEIRKANPQQKQYYGSKSANNKRTNKITNKNYSVKKTYGKNQNNRNNKTNSYDIEEYTLVLAGASDVPSIKSNSTRNTTRNITRIPQKNIKTETNLCKIPKNADFVVELIKSKN